MAFPYTYNKKLSFSLNIKFLNIKSNHIQQHFYSIIKHKQRISKITNSDEKFSFVSSVPVLNFDYSTDIIFKKENEDIKITYEVNLEKLITIVLVTVILTAFFSFVSIKYFLILAGILTVSIYGIFYLIIDNFIQNIIKESIENIIENQDEAEKYSDEQMLWINDNKRCSACGNYLSDFDLNCSECGIKLKRNKYTIPLDTSKYKDKQVLYHFKKKK